MRIISGGTFMFCEHLRSDRLNESLERLGRMRTSTKQNTSEVSLCRVWYERPDSSHAEEAEADMFNKFKT